ncbi:MAG: N-acetyltransferase [Terracidiphilus sp.]|nr:N-acetyltransferase [Terracidiphilus sp.]MDR3776599.1 N-acetyltransferase [Terracidiphilus sp.]
MLYRLYMPEDFAGLYAIEEVCFPPPFRFGRRYMRQLVNSSDAATWIAEDERRMAGFAIVEWTQDTGPRTAYIQTIEVAPDDRHRGIASELLRRLEGSARAVGAEAIELHVDAENAGAIRIYQAQGYVYQGREENYYALDRAALIFGKPLETAPGDSFGIK